MTRTRLDLAVGLAGLAGFLVTMALVVTGVSQSYDQQAALLVNGYDLGSAGTFVMVLLSNYGREVVWALVVLVMFGAGNKRTKILALELGLLFVAGIVVGEALKAIYFRERPFLADSAFVLRVAKEFDSSFPSGHALIVSIGAAFCVARFRHKLASALLCVEAGLVCYSRIYVGVHYPLDVVGGVFLGVAIALLGVPVVEKYLMSIFQTFLQPIIVVLREGPLDV